MASIKNVTILNFGRKNKTHDFAEISFEVHFSTSEVELNLTYQVHLAIVERNQKLDNYRLVPNGLEPGISVSGALPVYLNKEVIGEEVNRDHFLYFTNIHPTTKEPWQIKPNGEKIYQLKEIFAFYNESLEEKVREGSEEYHSMVWIVPELSMGFNYNHIPFTLDP